MSHEYEPRVSGVDVDFALEMSHEGSEITCDVRVTGDETGETKWVEVHQKLRNWTYLVRCKNSNVAYIVHYTSMTNLRYEWGG